MKEDEIKQIRIKELEHIIKLVEGWESKGVILAGLKMRLEFMKLPKEQKDLVMKATKQTFDDIKENGIPLLNELSDLLNAKIGDSDDKE